MKNIVDFLNEASEDNVYVVKDSNSEIINVFDTEEEANEEVKKWKDEASSNNMTVSKEPRSQYIK